MEREKLEKSIDSLIDKLFMKKAEPVPGFPSLDSKNEGSKENPQTPELAQGTKSADQVMATVPDSEDEKDGKNGRPRDPSNMDHRDADGESHLDFPSGVSTPNEDGHVSEQSQTDTSSAPEQQVSKSTVAISKEDFEFLKKARAAEKAEALKKAREEQANLIKSVVLEATKEIRQENADLKKSLTDTQEMLKKALRQPKPQKSVSSVAALEKSFGGNAPESRESETFSKSEMLDAAERLVKANKLPLEAAIELEDTGFMYNPAHRAMLEAELKRNR